MEFPKDLNAASASPLILAILQEKPSYGYAIIKRVAQLSDGQLQWAEGMLYPVLHRLEKSGQIEAFWKDSESGRKRKYYRIKEPGVEALQTHKEQWMAMHNILKESWKNIRSTDPSSDSFASSTS
jgi:PadR family transcriptional regulator, regulatory protein PadR